MSKAQTLNAEELVNNWIKTQMGTAGWQTKLVSLVDGLLSTQKAEMVKMIEEYAGHILNDGSGKPMKISVEEVLQDLLDTLNEGKG